MRLVNWVKGWFGDKKEFTLQECFFDLGIDYYYKKFAVETCIDIIANAIASCEIQTFEKGKKVKKDNYYLLNFEPNPNQNASQFFHTLVSRWMKDNEALVIMQDDYLYVAEDFDRKKYAFKENYYENVTIEGLTLSKIFHESEVLYFRLNDENIMDVIDGMYESFGKLLVSSMNYYKRKNNKRILIKGNFLRPQDEDTQEAINEFFESQLKTWFDANKEASAFQMQEGYEFADESDGRNTTGAGNNNTSRDIADLVNDIFNYVAMAFHVPRGILKGDVSDIENQIDSLIMFGIKPLVEFINDEFNRKIYKKTVLESSYLKVDTSKIKVVDINTFANAADKLFAIGGFSINDILEELGKERINEPWADYRYVTKNYERADAAKGGEGK